jgi:hypothetical protein
MRASSHGAPATSVWCPKTDRGWGASAFNAKLLAHGRGRPYPSPDVAVRKRVLLTAASILAARKLAQYDSGAPVPATVSAIADAVRWAEQIMEEIDRRHPVNPAQQAERRPADFHRSP